MTSSSTVEALIAFLLTKSDGFLVVLVTILTLISRYEFISPEILDRCKLLCETAKEYHNKIFQMEMKALIKEMGIGQGPFECKKGELYQRHIENQEKLNKQIQHFNNIKQKFPECNNKTFEEVKEKVEKISKKIQVEF